MRHSREVADVAAPVFEENGVEVHMFSVPGSTALGCYDVLNLDRSVGIVITTSHYSKEYKSYKVYDENGCRITDKPAYEIWK